jgi:parallel beta helix pectate lyase-like protein/flagellar hook capping protein FlgD
MFSDHGKLAALGVVVGLTSVLLAGCPHKVNAAGTVTIDYSMPAGQIDYHVGAGLGGPWADVLPDSMIALLKPPAVRIGSLWQNSNNLWARAAHNNTTVVIVVKDAVDARLIDPVIDKAFDHQWDAPPAPGDSVARMDEWIRHVHKWVDLAIVNRVVGEDTVRVQYDIWNEPDVAWHPDSSYNSLDLFFDVWNTAVDSIRVWDPGAIITGPSFAYAGPGAGSEVSTRSGLTMDIFLQRCYAAGTLPDVLGSHHIGYSDYTAPNSLDGLCRWNLYAQVVDLRDRVDTVFANIPGSGIDAHSFEYEINEMLNSDLPDTDYCNQPYNGPHVHIAVTPGVLVRNFALAERARADNLGLLFACRTVWCDPCSTCVGGPEFYLAHLLDPCAADVHGLFRPRYAWWVYRTYADITGSYVHASATGSVDAIAGMCASADTSRILIGNYSPGNATDLQVVLENLSSTDLVVNEAIQVTVKRLPGAPDSVYQAYEGLAPTLISNGRVPVDGDSAVLNIPSDKCGPGDALSIEVTPITPHTTVARGNFLTMEAAIQSADIGDLVLVYPDTVLGHPYQERNTHLKNGVRVAAATGYSPIIAADSVSVADTLIVFPENANAFTNFEGIELRGGPFTKVVAALRGAGSIKNCILKDMDQGSVIRGIVADEHTGEIRNCTVQMTSHSHTTGQTVVAMDLGDLTGANSSHVVGCSINAKTGYTQTYGIRTSIYADAVIESTFVTSENLGIDLWDNSVARFCTVDKTYYEGISGGTSARIENCIVTNMLGPWEHGIIGNNIDYCICPQGVSDFSGTGNSTEDPHYCATGIYTLRADSYGNPDNNTSGKQIGAFPVACLFGTLARNVTWNGTKPPILMPGDVTVPVGRSLTLSAGAVVKCGPGDIEDGGSDTTKAEIRVNGTFTVSGSQQAVKFTSALASPSPGDWFGLLFNTGAVVTVDSAIVEYSQSGMVFDHATSGSVSKARFRSNQNQDFKCANLGSSQGVTLEESNLQVAGSAGVWLDGGSSLVTIRKNTIAGAGSGGYGIQLVPTESDPGSPVLRENTISGFSSGAGIYISEGSPTITKNTISSCAAGIKTLAVGPGTPLIGQNGDSTSDNIITGNTTGIACDRPTLNPDTMNPTIRENKIQNNTYGITAKNGAAPDAGRSGNNHGNNILTGNTGHCIWNRNTGQHPPQISARFNYFGPCDGGGICWLGDVDASNALCSAPAGAEGPDLGMVALPENRSLIQRVIPNPTRAGVTVSLWVDEGGATVNIEAFDVAGRLVRKVADGRFSAGPADVSWNGLDEQGGRVPAGIYFLRAKTSAGPSQVARVLVLR